MDTQQTWTLLHGTATITTDDQTTHLTAGDTIVIPAHTPRRLTPGPDTGFTAIVTGPAPMHAYTPDDPTPIPLPWAA
ncbi:cupin domain-containing protein [Glycomyces sp. A-F 0318]|nr:cupin domain-containing protein [Glycomyces amatae]